MHSTDSAPRRAARARLIIAAAAVWLVLVGVLVPTLPATRIAARTFLLLPSFFASLPQSPFDRISAGPAQEVVDLQPVDGYVRAHVYRPRSGRHPALIISLGIDPSPPDDPRIVRLLDGLSRAGLVAILVESEALNQDRLYPDSPLALTEAVEFADSRTYVRTDRVGLFGFSIGGSMALLAGAQPSVRDRLRLIEAFGAYDTLADATVSVATHTLEVDRVVRRWQPDAIAQTHLANALLNALPDQSEPACSARSSLMGQCRRVSTRRSSRRQDARSTAC